MVPWMFPVGVLVAVALVSLSNVFAYIGVVVWGWVIFPHGAAYVRSHSLTSEGAPGSGDPDLDTHYWRTRIQ